ncbi:MAG: hypothetical protein AAF998_16445 [Bacteroidota bacterium]
MNTPEHTFVFAVCGAKEHIDTLNFSLPYLRRYSNANILVVTDLQRNSGKIAHDNVRHVATPVHFNHHQASIYLKTGLHKFVDLNNGLYCYLDSDVLAVREGVDEIFRQKRGPVTFAADHCRMREFSPQAVQCGCLDLQYERKERLTPLLEALIDSWEGIAEAPAPADSSIAPERRAEILTLLRDWSEQSRITDPALREKRKELLDLFAAGRSGGRGKLLTTLLFRILPRFVRHPFLRIWYDWRGNVIVHEEAQSYFRRKHGLDYRPEAGGWYDRSGQRVLEGFDALIFEQTGFRWDPAGRRYVDETGQPVFPAHCDHLRMRIRDKFSLDITDPEWQHWNGGVFLFGADSVEFMETWHRMTQDIFRDAGWRTRDQGTLIATAWKLGLQDQPPLDSRFNFLADYHQPELEFDPRRGFTLDGFTTVIRPYFAHIYHHFGDEDWAVWRWILTR